MATPYNHRATSSTPMPPPDGTLALSAGSDFVTPDGRLVPRALGEAGLRQRTALLVGGMLIGHWPDHLQVL